MCSPFKDAAELLGVGADTELSVVSSVVQVFAGSPDEEEKEWWRV